MKSICVFCGANFGNDPLFLQAAQNVGTLLAREKITLVYGGAKIGLMGALADATMQAQGHVIGVIPQKIVANEKAHTQISDLRIVNTMHERKALMESLSDGFIVLPGGFGTLDEIFEILTWMQLGLHDKPIGFLNVNHYYDALFSFLDHAVSQQLLKPEHRAKIYTDSGPRTLLSRMQNHEPVQVAKWIETSEV